MNENIAVEQYNTLSMKENIAVKQYNQEYSATTGKYLNPPVHYFMTR
jgi:hypothetical protein